jgi:aspartate beta-hydroxylase
VEEFPGISQAFHMPSPEQAHTDRLLGTAREHEQAGRLSQAEAVYRKILLQDACQLDALMGVAAIALGSGDRGLAENLLHRAHNAQPAHAEVAQRLATLLAATGRAGQAMKVLERLLGTDASAHVAWLLLAELRHRSNDAKGALQASFQAITRAQAGGHWLNQDSTPAPLLTTVLSAIERLRKGRRELFFDAYATVRDAHGSAALARMDKALRAYLKEEVAEPSHPRQRPFFFYFPDLPEGAYHDPHLHPWASRLADAFPEIRREATAILEADSDLPDFFKLPPGTSMDKYLGGSAQRPAWQAFFFYRHGRRYDANHARCPVTSEVLDSLDLCRIADQAPEICYSVIRPHTVLKAHHGVTNARLVMHLPLIVPPDCALNVVDVGEHQWREGELMMFDDTYLHEAWNRSDRSRVIVLMDCWNPHLTGVERLAVKALIETISALTPENHLRESAD